MAAPLNQRHVTAQEMVEQARRNRRQAAILESRSGQQASYSPSSRTTASRFRRSSRHS